MDIPFAFMGQPYTLLEPQVICEEKLGIDLDQRRRGETGGRA
jgi:hypothetical protein